MVDALDSQVFDLLENGEEIDLFNRDLSRPLSEEEIFSVGTEMHSGKITDDSDINFRSALALAEWVSPHAAAVNAVLYVTEGKYGMAALSTMGAIPIVGKFLKNLALSWKAIDKGEKTVDLYRAVRNIDDPATMIKGNKVIGNWEKQIIDKAEINVSGVGSPVSLGLFGNRKILDTGISKGGHVWQTSVSSATDIRNTIFVSPNKEMAMTYLRNDPGMLMKFKVPVSYVNDFARGPGSHGVGLHKYGGWGSEKLRWSLNEISEGLSFTEGLPIEYLRLISTVSGN